MFVTLGKEESKYTKDPSLLPLKISKQGSKAMYFAVTSKTE